MRPIDLLAAGVASYDPYLADSGELLDPVFDEPTQYGTPYHALCRAILATEGPAEDRQRQIDLAAKGMDAALAHVEDVDGPPVASHVDRVTGSLWSINHRDFFWPAILKTYRLLKALDPEAAAPFAERIKAVEVPEPFRTVPPSNWAMVWLSGEWLRMAEGLSSTTKDRFDEWLGEFFASHIILDMGLYTEPGLPNSYDLFTRLHLAEIMAAGYEGRWRKKADELMRTGLQRSLRMQLSDGSLASAHRSTGQAWTDAAQVAFFTHAANHFASRDEGLAEDAKRAAVRAFISLARWQRPDGPFSPVQNVLPPSWRVGYERYTADAHYANLALAFLGWAIVSGFDGDADPTPREQAPVALAEGDPTNRAVAHNGPYSVHINGDPHPDYDGFGMVDITFGPDRLLHFSSSVHHLSEPGFFNVGTALRTGPGRSRLRVLAQRSPELDGPIRTSADGVGLELSATVPPMDLPLRSKAKRAVLGKRERPASDEEHSYQISVRIDGDGVHVDETTPGLEGPKTLLVPYLRDAGAGQTTEVSTDTRGHEATILLTLGDEAVRIDIHAAVAEILDLAHGYENRRGLCGLLRVDLKDPSEVVSYTLSIER